MEHDCHKAPALSAAGSLRRRAAIAFGCIAVTISIFVTGCSQSRYLRQALTPSYVPSNVFTEEPNLPANLRRVALLPSGAISDSAEMAFGLESMEPALRAALARVRTFELVPVSRDELRLLTGRSDWRPDDKLPPDLFDKLKEKLAVDAVLFSTLTAYRAYEPIAIGWRIKLIDADEPHIIWAVDEIFDARVPEVAAAAVRHAEHHRESASSLEESRSVLTSVRRFGHYAASAVVGTMPGRNPVTADKSASDP